MPASMKHQQEANYYNNNTNNAAYNNNNGYNNGYSNGYNNGYTAPTQANTPEMQSRQINNLQPGQSAVVDQQRYTQNTTYNGMPAQQTTQQQTIVENIGAAPISNNNNMMAGDDNSGITIKSVGNEPVIPIVKTVDENGNEVASKIGQGKFDAQGNYTVMVDGIPITVPRDQLQ